MNASTYRMALRPWITDAIIRFVEMKLAADGGVNRRDIMDHFGVSPVTASKYLKAFKDARPDLIRYDPNTKQYVMVRSATLDGTVFFKEVADYIIPVGAWLEQEHIRMMKTLGRNPDEHSSEFSLAADALRSCIRKMRHGKR